MSEGKSHSEAGPNSPEFRRLLGTVGMFASLGGPLKNADSILFDGLYDSDPNAIVGDHAEHSFEQDGLTFKVDVASHHEVSGMVNEDVRTETGATRLGFIRFDIDTPTEASTTEERHQQIGLGSVSLWSDGRVTGDADLNATGPISTKIDTVITFLRSLGYDDTKAMSPLNSDDAARSLRLAHDFPPESIEELTHTLTDYLMAKRASGQN